MERLYTFRAIPKHAVKKEYIEGDLIQCDEAMFIFPVGFELTKFGIKEDKGLWSGFSLLVEVDPSTVELIQKPQEKSRDERNYSKRRK